MLLSPGSLALMGKGFIFGDFLGITPFKWNRELERPELNLSRKRIAGGFVSFAVTLLGVALFTERFMGEKGQNYYTTLTGVAFSLLSVAMQCCTAVSCKKLPSAFLEIQAFSRSFSGLPYFFSSQ